MKITTKEKSREENKLLTTIMTDFSDSLQHSHILEEMSNKIVLIKFTYFNIYNYINFSHLFITDFPFIYGFSPVTEDGVPIRKLFISNLAQRVCIYIFNYNLIKNILI